MQALLTDLYQLTMLQVHLERGMNGQAVFELFVRRLPAGRRFLVAAGLEQAPAFLEELHVEDDELRWLSQLDRFSPKFLDASARSRFATRRPGSTATVPAVQPHAADPRARGRASPRYARPTDAATVGHLAAAARAGGLRPLADARPRRAHGQRP